MLLLLLGLLTSTYASGESCLHELGDYAEQLGYEYRVVFSDILDHGKTHTYKTQLEEHVEYLVFTCGRGSAMNVDLEVSTGKTPLVVDHRPARDALTYVHPLSSTSWDIKVHMVDSAWQQAGFYLVIMSNPNIQPGL